LESPTGVIESFRGGGKAVIFGGGDQDGAFAVGGDGQRCFIVRQLKLILALSLLSKKITILSHEEFAILSFRFVLHSNNGDKFVHAVAKSK
jgi:hypothetical protein